MTEEIRFAPLDDGSEEENQCARCGSTVTRIRCWSCGGDGVVELADDNEDYCFICVGDGGWWACLSTPEWCEANPIPGREWVARGKVEWFTVERS